jgi:hypothetical protein
MTYIANVTGDRTFCVMADGGLEVISDVAGAIPFRTPGGGLNTAVCDAALEGSGFRRTGEWQSHDSERGVLWTAEVTRE